MGLDRRQFLLASGSVALAPHGAFAASNPYRDSIVIDGLGFPGNPNGEADSGLDATAVDDVRSSGLTACHLTIGSVGSMPPLQAFEAIVRGADYWDTVVDTHPAVFSRVRSVDDIDQAKFTQGTGLIYGLQDGVAFEDDLDRLPALHRAGVRVIQPTYNRRNLLGDGCMEPSDAGLSRTGTEAIERLCELGFTLDLSHCGRRTTSDALAAATRPVSFTHTGCHALAEHPRHRSDSEIRAVANSGGITGIYIMPYLAKGAQPTARDVVLHLEHAIDVGGEDHVSLGTDGNISPTLLTDEYRKAFQDDNRRRKALGIAAPFETDEGYLFASELNSPRRFETLADLLLDRGHSSSRVEKILGANLRRVFAETWNS